MKKLTLLVAMLAMLLVVTAAPALAQPTEAKIDEDVFSKSEKGKAAAKAGGTEAKAECPDGIVKATSGDIYAQAPCKAPPPPPPPPKAPPPPPPPPPPGPPPPPPPPKMEEKKELPKTGGSSSAALLALGAGALLVGGGLLVRRFVR